MSSNVLQRVIFYSKTDGASGYNLSRAEELLNAIDLSHCFSLNDLLELYHINMYFENNMFLTSWDNATIGKYKATIKEAFELARQYFYSLNNENILQHLEAIEFNYRKAFWELFAYFRTFQRIDRIQFTEVLKDKSNHLQYILHYKQLVTHFGNEIRAFMLGFTESAELLLARYEQHHDRDISPIYFPQSLKHVDIEAIILAYINSAQPNLNYVQLILNSNSNELRIAPKVKFLAKKKAQELNDSILESSSGMRIGVQVTFDKDQIPPINLYYDDGMTEISVSEPYLNTLGSNEELFRVFTSLFGFMDEQGLITLVSKESDLNFLESTSMKSKSEYEIGMIFHRNALLAFAQFMSFQHYLKRERNIDIENLIEDFIKNKINTSLNNQNLRFKLPSGNSSTLEKIRTLAPEFEFLLKQYNSYLEDGIIDFELLEFTSTPIRFSELKSAVKKKYIYGSNDRIQLLKNCFFSDQSGLYYIAEHKDKYNNLYDLLVNEDVHFDHFLNYQQETINYLIQEGYLEIDEERKVRLKQPILIYLVGILYRDGVLNFWHFPESYRFVIDEMISCNMLEARSTLFSSQEVSYFNFYLNKKEYTNGLDLRNKYMHGNNSISEDEQRKEYCLLLILVILALLKIDDDLELQKKQRIEPPK